MTKLGREVGELLGSVGYTMNATLALEKRLLHVESLARQEVVELDKTRERCQRMTKLARLNSTVAVEDLQQVLGKIRRDAANLRRQERESGQKADELQSQVGVLLRQSEEKDELTRKQRDLIAKLTSMIRQTAPKKTKNTFVTMHPEDEELAMDEEKREYFAARKIQREWKTRHYRGAPVGAAQGGEDESEQQATTAQNVAMDHRYKKTGEEEDSLEAFLRKSLSRYPGVAERKDNDNLRKKEKKKQ